MTNKELIEQLQRFPADAHVMLIVDGHQVEINCVRPGGLGGIETWGESEVIIEHRASCPKEK
jgi:hypothetical protein